MERMGATFMTLSMLLMTTLTAGQTKDSAILDQLATRFEGGKPAARCYLELLKTVVKVNTSSNLQLERYKPQGLTKSCQKILYQDTFPSDSCVQSNYPSFEADILSGAPGNYKENTALNLGRYITRKERPFTIGSDDDQTFAKGEVYAKIANNIKSTKSIRTEPNCRSLYSMPSSPQAVQSNYEFIHNLNQILKNEAQGRLLLYMTHLTPIALLQDIDSKLWALNLINEHNILVLWDKMNSITKNNIVSTTTVTTTSSSMKSTVTTSTTEPPVIVNGTTGGLQLDSESTDLWQDGDLAGWDQIQDQTSFMDLDEDTELSNDTGSAVEPPLEEVVSSSDTGPENNIIEYSAEEIKQIAKYKLLFPGKSDEEIYKDLPGLTRLSSQGAYVDFKPQQNIDAFLSNPILNSQKRDQNDPNNLVKDTERIANSEDLIRGIANKLDNMDVSGASIMALHQTDNNIAAKNMRVMDKKLKFLKKFDENVITNFKYIKGHLKTLKKITKNIPLMSKEFASNGGNKVNSVLDMLSAGDCCAIGLWLSIASITITLVSCIAFYMMIACKNSGSCLGNCTNKVCDCVKDAICCCQCRPGTRICCIECDKVCEGNEEAIESYQLSSRQNRNSNVNKRNRENASQQEAVPFRDFASMK